MEMNQHGSNADNQTNASQAPYELRSRYQRMQDNGQGHLAERNPSGLSHSGMQIPERDPTQIPGSSGVHNSSSESQFSNAQSFNDQHANVSDQASNSVNQAKQIPFGSLLPLIVPELDKDRVMQLQTLYAKLRRNEITKEGFVRLMRGIIGDQMLRLAVVKLQAKGARNSQTGPSQFQMQSQNTMQQHHMRPPTSSAAQFSDHYSLAQVQQKGPGAPTDPSLSQPPMYGVGSYRPYAGTNVNTSTPVSMGFVKHERVDQANDQQRKAPFSSSQGAISSGVAQFERGNAVPGTLADGLSERQPSGMVFSTSTGLASTDSGFQNASANPALGAGTNTKTPVKKPSMGQKKPLDGHGSPPSASKKQKVSGVSMDQSIEHLNDVTAVSGVNLREEEEQLFSGAKDENRVSEASRRVVQEEEEKLIFQKIPLQRKLEEIMKKHGVKNLSNDVEKCLSLSVEERLRGLVGHLIRMSKQRADLEKSRHRTTITSDVRRQILAINQKAREEWEKKQAEAEKLRKGNEPESSAAVDGDKEKDDGQSKSLKINKEEDDKMRATAANVAARAAVGGDDMLSKWQLMAEQARQKREGGPDAVSGLRSGKDSNHKPLSSSTGNSGDNQGAGKRDLGTAVSGSGNTRQYGKTPTTMSPPKAACTISVKDVISVLEREPQMAKSAIVYRLYERLRPNTSAE